MTESGRLIDRLAGVHQRTVAHPPEPHLKRVARLGRLLERHPPPEEQGTYVLVVQSSRTAAWVRLPEEGIVVGRREDCDLCLQQPGVSKEHCRIGFDGEDWQAIDLGSTNGTLVNGARVASRFLCHGDVIQIGGVLLVFIPVESTP